MAIEFDCPYCTATIRVRDENSGKIGRCPMCATRIRVPWIAPPAASAAPQPTIDETPSDTDIALFSPRSPMDPPSPGLSKPVPSPEPALGPGGVPPLIQVKPDPVVTSPYLRKRRKKSSAMGALLPPLIFGGLLIAIGFVYLYWSRPSYQGTLTASRLDPNQAISTSIGRKDFAVLRENFSQIIDDLRQHPSSIRSNLVNVVFGGGPEGMNITIRPGIDAELVKVPVLELKSLQEFYLKKFDALNGARLAEMQTALVSMSEQWAHAPENQKSATLADYRDKIAYNAFLLGLGRICEAIVDQNRYPCVHEDGEGSLYFLIPVGTRTFRIRERMDLQLQWLPSNFEITVQVPPPQQQIKREPVFETEPEPVITEPYPTTPANE